MNTRWGSYKGIVVIDLKNFTEEIFILSSKQNGIKKVGHPERFSFTVPTFLAVLTSSTAKIRFLIEYFKDT